jgi:hypothetical protein
LTPLDRTLRAFDLHQPNPPIGNPNTVSQVLFNEDSTALITLVKGDPSVPDNHGFLSVYPVVDGKVSRDGIRSSPNGTTSLFGSALIPGTSSLLVSDPTIGAAVVDIGKSGRGKTLSIIPITGQIASCWAIYSSKTKTVFVTDGAINSLVEIDPATSTVVADTILPNPNKAMIDIIAAGNFVYALWPGDDAAPAAVVVVDVSGGKGSAKEVQNFVPQGITKQKSSQGLVAYV